MGHSRSTYVPGGTDSIHSDPTVRELRVRSDQTTQPGFALGERPFFQAMDEIFDTEALGSGKVKGCSCPIPKGEAEKLRTGALIRPNVSASG